MPLPTAVVFVNTVLNEKNQLPGSLRDIFEALDKVHNSPPGTEDKISSLYILYKECREWLKNKGNSPPSSSGRKRACNGIIR